MVSSYPSPLVSSQNGAYSRTGGHPRSDISTRGYTDTIDSAYGYRCKTWNVLSQKYIRFPRSRMWPSENET